MPWIAIAGATALGLAATALWRRRLGYRWAPWLIAAIVVAGGGTALARAAGGGPGALPGVGLPLAANPRLIPVYLTGGQELALNAQVFPVAVVRLGDTAAVQRIAGTYAKQPGPKRPLWLVVTGFPTAAPDAALRQTQAWLQQAHVTLPWAAQVGPPTLYSPTLPALVALDAQGHVQRAAGLAAVLRALPGAVRLPAAASPTHSAPAKGGA